MGLATFKQDGVEADDLIASLVVHARAEGLNVVIVAADKDLMQLVSPEVLLWDSMRERVFGREEVETRFGVAVHQLRDLLALMGDTSDNIPGVPSVGPKTAKDLLGRFETLEGVYENIASVERKKLKQALIEYKDQALLSQRLVTLKNDCPVQFDGERLRDPHPDVDKLKALYTELGFQRQLKVLIETTPTDPSEAGSTRELEAPNSPQSSTQTLVTIKELDDLVAQAQELGRLALDVVTEGSTIDSPIVGLGLAVNADKAYYLPLEHRYVGAPESLSWPGVHSRLKALLEDPEVKKSGHDLKKLALHLASQGLELVGFYFDSKIASYLLNQETPHTLEAISLQTLEWSLPTYEEVTQKVRRRQLAFEQVPVDAATRYMGLRTAAVERLESALAERLDELGLLRLFNDVEIPLARLLSQLERDGVQIDSETLKVIGESCQVDINRLETQAHEVAGKAFNVHAPRQLEIILFDEMGLKPLKRTKTSRSTDAATLEALADEHELPKLILKLRQIAKLKSTYIDALPALVHPKTGRIHTTWEQTVAATGRLSSLEPNLQNIPIRTELGRSIRATFTAPDGMQLVSADYSQIELRVLAHLSEDERLLEAFRSNQDVHTRTAMEVFEVGEEGVTSEMRSRAKAVNFGVIYGQGDSGLAKALGITKMEAGNFIASYFRRYKGVSRFMRQTLEKARAGKAIQSLLGRRRLLPEIKSSNRARRLAAERIAMNMPIQGTAADLLKLAMLALRIPVTPGTKMIMSVHDELVFEVPNAELPQAEAAIRKAMEHVYPLAVPLTVSIGHGPNWNAAH